LPNVVATIEICLRRSVHRSVILIINFDAHDLLLPVELFKRC
jgi:hypothetical protein